MMFPRSVQRSRLVRLVQQWSGNPGAAAAPPHVARLAQGLGAFDAVRLAGALGQIEAYAPIAPALHAPPTAAAGPAASDGRALAPWTAVVAQVQALPADLRTAMAERPAPEDTDWTLHAHRIAALQHRMAARVAGLRQHVRQRMAQDSVRLRQLAALDQSLEHALAAREHAALSTLVAHLGQRFAQRLGGTPPPAPGACPAPTGQAQTALNGFERDVRAALEAELHLRLQPVVGLLAAAVGPALGSAA